MSQKTIELIRALAKPFRSFAGCGLMLVVFHSTAAEKLSVIKPVIICDQLNSNALSQQLDIKVTITKTETLKTANGNFCKVNATIAPSINVEVALPSEHWTQRFLQVGCGGLCGGVNLSFSNANGCAPATKGEFAMAATNMGHNGSMMDASWAEDPQKRIDFAYRANHLTAKLAKSLVHFYYGQAPKYNYFMGCSDGGREGLVEAQRYPKDFDGITAGAPAAFFQFQNSFFHGWNVTANLRTDGTAILLKDRLPLLHRAVLNHCPTLSGVNDGLLENPYACHFSDKWVKLCAKGQKVRTDCLTTEEIAVVKKLYRGPYDSAGEQFVTGGLPLGSEMRWTVPDTTTRHSTSEMMVIPALQSVLLTEPKTEITSMKDFPLNRQNFDAVAKLATLYNGANTNLAPFQKQGGKLIVWHGLADDSVSPSFSLAYYRGVSAELGAATVEKFMRLFLLPGVGHCGGGDGYDQIDLLTPLMAWTEQGIAPEKIITGMLAHSQTQGGSMDTPTEGKSVSKFAESQFHGTKKPSSPVAPAMAEIKATRPVFPYPYIAHYVGKGAVNDAENYTPALSKGFESLRVGQPAGAYIGPDNQRQYQVVEGKLTEK